MAFWLFRPRGRRTGLETKHGMVLETIRFPPRPSPGFEKCRPGFTAALRYPVDHRNEVAALGLTDRLDLGHREAIGDRGHFPRWLSLDLFVEGEPGQAWGVTLRSRPRRLFE